MSIRQLYGCTAAALFSGSYMHLSIIYRFISYLRARVHLFLFYFALFDHDGEGRAGCFNAVGLRGKNSPRNLSRENSGNIRYVSQECSTKNPRGLLTSRLNRIPRRFELEEDSQKGPRIFEEYCNEGWARPWHWEIQVYYTYYL